MRKQGSMWESIQWNWKAHLLNHRCQLTPLESIQWNWKGTRSRPRRPSHVSGRIHSMELKENRSVVEANYNALWIHSMELKANQAMSARLYFTLAWIHSMELKGAEHARAGASHRSCRNPFNGIESFMYPFMRPFSTWYALNPFNGIESRAVLTPCPLATASESIQWNWKLRQTTLRHSILKHSTESIQWNWKALLAHSSV